MEEINNQDLVIASQQSGIPKSTDQKPSDIEKVGQPVVQLYNEREDENNSKSMNSQTFCTHEESLMTKMPVNVPNVNDDKNIDETPIKRPLLQETAQKTEKDEDDIDWVKVRSELTCREMWNDRKTKEFFKHLSIVAVSKIVPSIIDIVTDAYSAYTFYNGTLYIKDSTKNSTTENELDISNSVGGRRIHEDCDKIGYYTSLDTGEITNRFQCFERDPIWAMMTLVFMFIPGVFVWDVYILQLGKTGLLAQTNIILCVLFKLLVLMISVITFPLQLMACKIISLVNPGEEWEKVDMRVTRAEGRWESSLQLCLQLFIILTRGDRHPSTIQIFALTCNIFVFLII